MKFSKSTEKEKKTKEYPNRNKRLKEQINFTDRRSLLTSRNQEIKLDEPYELDKFEGVVEDKEDDIITQGADLILNNIGEGLLQQQNFQDPSSEEYG